MTPPGFRELHCLSNHSFPRGASHLEERVETAAGLDDAALASTDECSVAGVVKAHLEARRRGLKLIAGSEFSRFGWTGERSPTAAGRHGPDRVPEPEPGLSADGTGRGKLILLAADREGYAIRLGKPLPALGYALFPDGERHLRPRSRLARIHPPKRLGKRPSAAPNAP